MSLLDVVLPAGGRVDEFFAAKAGTDLKALMEIDGEPILSRTLAALRETGLVDRTVVIGPREVRDHPSGAEASHCIEEGSSGPDNIYRGLDFLMASDRPPRRLLVVTTDLPFLGPQILRDFVAACPAESDFCVPLISEEAFRNRFPGTSATFVRLRDNTWTTGCAYVLGADALMKARPHIERVFMNRKSKLGMARMLGLPFVLKWLTKRLSLHDVETKIKGLLGSSGTAVLHSAPELAFDIDYLEDYEYAQRHAALPAQDRERPVRE